MQPMSWQGAVMPIKTVAVVAVPGVQPFELGVAWEGFGIDRSDEGIPSYDTSLVAMTRTVKTGAGWSISTPHGLDHAATADLVIVPAYTGPRGTDLASTKGIEP